VEHIRNIYWDYNLTLKPHPYGKSTDIDLTTLIKVYKHLGFEEHPYKKDRLWLKRKQKLSKKQNGN
jgi:hypothetical protein